MLGFGKMVLDFVVDPGGDGMSLAKRQVSIAGDLHIHKVPGAELTGFDIVQGQYPFLLDYQFLQLGEGFFVDGAVQHLAQSIQQNLNGRAENECADDQRGDGIQGGEAQPGTGHADENTAGGKDIGAVVEGVGHEGIGGCAGPPGG